MTRSFAWLTRTVAVTMVAFCFTTTALAQSQPATPPSQLDSLYAVLRSDASRLKKIEACKKLGAIGTADSVPALADLLADPRLSHAARIGLEAIPDPRAAAALRDAVPKLKGELLIGVLNSLGARRDPLAVSVMDNLLKSEDTQVASAAAFALGRIASESATEALLAALPSVGNETRAAIGKSGLIAAQQCIRDDHRTAAADICRTIMMVKVPEHIRLAAAQGVLLSGTTIDADLLSGLMSQDANSFVMALTIAREVPGEAITNALRAQMPHATIGQQVLLIAALGDREDNAAMPTVLAATESANATLRAAAISALAHFRHDAVRTRLLDLACGSNAQTAQVACKAIAQLDDPDMDAMILKELKGADMATRIALYRLIGRRQIIDGLDALLHGVEAEDVAERVAALEALGSTIPANQLSVLTTRLVTKTTPEELEAARLALLASCVRLSDAETCAKEIVVCLPRTTGSAHLQLYELLGLVGGTTALEAVTEAAKNPDPELQETITRVLGQWMTPDAAPLLLDIAKKQGEEKYRIRALRGYIRILRQFDMPHAQRIEMCRKAMPLAKRPSERLLMLDALLRVPSRESLSLALTQLDNAEVSHRACEVTLILSNLLAEQTPGAVIDAMEKVLATTRDATFKGYAQQLMAKAKRKKGVE